MDTSWKLILAATLFSLNHAIVAEMMEYTRIKPLLLQAIDAPDGRARGILKGEVASFFRRTTQSDRPLVATVTTVGEFSQPDCKRLNLHLSQQGVRTVSGDRKAFDAAYGINFCRDGDVPQIGSKYIPSQQ